MHRRPLRLSALAILVVLSVVLNAPVPCHAASPDLQLSRGETVYVPVYSNVFSGPKNLALQLAATLCVRNTDTAASLSVTSVDYYDTNGKLLRRYLAKPVVLPPLGTTYVHLPEKDESGGFGANFIVRWKAERPINIPIIECVMIGATSGQGISFVSPGRAIRERARQ